MSSRLVLLVAPLIEVPILLPLVFTLLYLIAEVQAVIDLGESICEVSTHYFSSGLIKLLVEGLVTNRGAIPVAAEAANNRSSMSSSSKNEFKFATQNSPESLKLLTPCKFILVLQSLD